MLKASAQKVWDYISEPASYKKFSGVKEFTCEEKALNAKIELTGKDGKKRSQYISVIDYDVFKICYFVTRSDYAGDKQWVYAFEVHPKGDKKCEVVLSVYNGFDELSPEFKKGMTEEFDTIIASLQKNLNSDITRGCSIKVYVMKKLFVLIVLMAGIIWGAEAQSKGITFEQTKEWKKVLKKAKKEKKLIFIDCYTSWCGPCKMLSSQCLP